MKKNLIIMGLFLGVNVFIQAGRVTLPNAEVLNGRLSNAGFNHLIQKTNIIDQLANKELDPLEVAECVKSAFSDYKKYLQNPMLAAAVIIRKDALLEILFQDYPQELQELNDFLKFHF